jgi:hypothetical protein
MQKNLNQNLESTGNQSFFCALKFKRFYLTTELGCEEQRWNGYGTGYKEGCRYSERRLFLGGA